MKKNHITYYAVLKANACGLLCPAFKLKIISVGYMFVKDLIKIGSFLLKLLYPQTYTGLYSF